MKKKNYMECRTCGATENMGISRSHPSGYSGYCRPCARAVKYRSDKNTGRTPRSKKLWQKYRITESEFAARIVAQGGGCAICGTTKAKRAGGYSALEVDHDHTTGAVRGVLCYNCNRMLGNAKDKVELLRGGIEYLEGIDFLLNPETGEIRENT